MMNLNTVLYHLNGIIVIDDLTDYSVLFQPYTGETMGLNKTGLSIWNNIDGINSLHDISLKISNEFNIPFDTSSKDILEFAKKLYRRFFVVRNKSEQIKIQID